MQAYGLIAEPHLVHAALYSRLLRDEGLDPFVVRDGYTAKTTMRSRGVPDLLVTELSLPCADGFSVLWDLRDLARPRRPPAIVISAFADLREAAWRLRDLLGVKAVLPKHLPEAEIRQAVRQGLAAAENERYADDDTAPRYGDPDRLARIAAMGVVDDLPPDEALQRLVAETAAQFRVPIAVVSIVLGDRQWFKAHHGLGGAFLADRGSPIDGAFCRHVVDACAPLVVPDASAHPVFATNPSFVRHGVRGYAGAPLVTPDGDVLGTLCIIDSKPLAIVYDDRGPGPAPPS